MAGGTTSGVLRTSLRGVWTHRAALLSVGEPAEQRRETSVEIVDHQISSGWSQLVRGVGPDADEDAGDADLLGGLCVEGCVADDDEVPLGEPAVTLTGSL
ncbi:MAG TPA: hypothetical protein VIL36_06140, partial [Acidimicrobiales bacterium]